jgi:hypothetical protein
MGGLAMRLPVFLLIVIVGMALLLSLGGCLSTKPPLNIEPWVFYQASDSFNQDSPAPFFLTIEEAQNYCERMNTKPHNNYQVNFIIR